MNAHDRSKERKELVLLLVSQGMAVMPALADPRVGVSYSGYRKWRQRDPRWAAAIDVARAAHENNVPISELTSAQFALRYFNRVRAPFQQQFIDEMETMRPGNIVLSLWPPEHGKTTTFEDYATEKIARKPEWRSTVASESDAISKRIIGRIRNRLEPDGPFPALVRDWGPFRPDVGRSGSSSAFSQPWNADHFSVFKKRANDERDHTMLAIGWRSTTVSIRTDHLHIDDPQSTKTVNMNDKLLEWFRQDALSRPGETGITSIAMTRVGDVDLASILEEDEELHGILKVIKFKAIQRDAITGEETPLWPERFSLDGLDRIRRKVKDEAFDRNYMMAPGVSRAHRTFSDGGFERAVRPWRQLGRYNEWSDETTKPTLVLALDPGLMPGLCTLMGWVMTPESMELVFLRESDVLVRNEQIIDMLTDAVRELKPHFRVAHCVIEAMNFQRGLARDERLEQLRLREGFTVGEHITGINKYNENIGLASMAGDYEAGKIGLPWADDNYTRTEVDEIRRQLKAWKPLVRGNRLRQDRVMVMWFAWIWWQDRKGSLDRKPVTWRRQGLSSVTSRPSLIIPIGATL